MARPRGQAAGRGRRQPRPAGEHCRRDVTDAIRYPVKERVQWRAMPADSQPCSTAYDCLAGCEASGVEIVKRTAAHAFVVLRRRWVVERTFASITRSPRTVRDYERLPQHHATRSASPSSSS